MYINSLTINKYQTVHSDLAANPGQGKRYDVINR